MSESRTPCTTSIPGAEEFNFTFDANPVSNTAFQIGLLTAQLSELNRKLDALRAYVEVEARASHIHRAELNESVNDILDALGVYL